MHNDATLLSPEQALPFRGDLMRIIRRRKGIGQDRMAKKVGVSVTFLNLCETGKKWPSIAVARKIERALKLKKGELLR